MSDDSSLWQTAEELCEATPETPESAIEEIMILGAITELTAFIKAGKTTFLGAGLRALFTGDEFIGLRSQPVDVLYLTEEGPNTFRSMLAKSGLDHQKRLHVLGRGKVWRMPWREILADVVLPKIEQTNARYIIVDTISRWSGIKGDDENQTGPALEAMEPLEALRDNGIGVMIVRHARKSGGDIGEAARGASAWGGASDVLLQITNPRTQGHPNRRVLESLGRFYDSSKWTIDLEMGRYRLIGRGETAEREQAKSQIVGMQGSFTLLELAEEIGVSKDTVERAMHDLIPAGKILISGRGVKGDPKVYHLGKNSLQANRDDPAAN